MSGVILVVDDDFEIRQMLCTLLTFQGYETIEAVDGRDALEKLTHFLPDALILDVMMPHMDGITLCRYLRREPTTARLPIVMLSGKAQAEAVQAGLAAGANRYLTKPMSLEALMACLHELC